MLSNVRAITTAVGAVAGAWWLVSVAASVLDRGGSVLVDGWKGVAASLFTTGLAALLSGAVLGLLVASSLRGTHVRDATARGWRALRVWLGQDGAGARGSADLLLGAVVVAAASGASFAVIRASVDAFARPRSVAGVGAAAHLGIVLAAVLLALLLRGPVRRLVARWAGVSRAGWIVRAPWRLAALLALAGLTVAVVVIVRNRAIVEYVPWPPFARGAGGLVLAGLGALAVHRLGLLRTSRARRATWIAIGVVWLACGIVGATLSHRAPSARLVLEEDVVPGRPGLAMIAWASDFDGDGYRPVFGGGDCAPFDVAIHPAATDLPGNGVDEDCDGVDLGLEELTGQGELVRHPVPGSFPEQPDVLLITIDAFAARHMGALGYERAVTNNLDRMTRGGVLFESCFSQGPSTRLSLPSMMTSRYDTEIDVKPKQGVPHPLRGSNRMLAEIMRDAGWATAAVVPTPYFTERRWPGLTQGFAEVDETAANNYQEHRHPHTAPEVVEAAVDVLEGMPDGKPVFLWAHFFDAHPPHRRPGGGPKFGDAKVDRYDAELHHVDTHVHFLVREAREILGREPLVVVTSDHGVGFDEPRYRLHEYGYDLNTITLHVPMLWSASFLPARRVESLCSTLDLVPTLVDLLDIEGSFDFRGYSLVPEMFDQFRGRPQLLFHELRLAEHENQEDEVALTHVGVRTPRYNFVLDREDGRAHLWSWQRDYPEREDLVASPEPQVAAQRKLLREAASGFVYWQKHSETAADDGS